MRITGGALRSRALKAPKGMTTRPTSDRVREALFNIVADECPGASVLDLYAGTGALGLEALSRGAVRAVFVERGKDALAALAHNVRALGQEARARVLAVPVERAVRALLLEGARFDLVFADPPYADVKSGAVATAGDYVALLAPGATLVLEHAQRDAPPSLPGLAFVRTRTYGDTSLSFYVADAPSEPDESPGGGTRPL
jgi:16S rRNA (guanine966-N2)-methyltransferase